MARGKLTARTVAALKEPGRYGDGGGLYLEIGPGGAKRWTARLQANGRRHDIGLGSVDLVPLAAARERTLELRRAYRDGRDPLAERRAARDKTHTPSFAEAARACHAEHAPSWRNAKHAAQFISTLETHIFPHFGDQTVDAVDEPMVRDALAPIWLRLPETARRVRQRVGTVLDYASAKGWRSAPLNMKAVSAGLPKQPKRDQHFAAMPWQDVPAFLDSLRRSDRATAPVRAGFEFLVLTAARSGEVRLAAWGEIDREARLWRIPAERMKAGKAHEVPLSDRAMALLDEASAWRTSTDPGEIIFPGARAGRPMSDMTLTALLRRLEVQATAHGMRSAFRDWAAEQTNVPREVAEMCLAHSVGSSVERAYARSTLLDRRRALLGRWSAYCTGTTGAVVPLHAGGRAASAG